MGQAMSAERITRHVSNALSVPAQLVQHVPNGTSKTMFKQREASQVRL